MSKAEERALEAYPIKMGEMPAGMGGLTLPYDINERSRIKFQQGYEQAEKDLALTVQDLELLHTFLYAVKNNKSGCFTFTRLSDEQYQEVLRRFKEAKK